MILRVAVHTGDVYHEDMATLTAETRTRKSGDVVVIRAHNNNGDKITETTCATFGCDYLVVNLWYRPSGSRVIIGIQGNVIDTAQKYTPTLTVRLRTNDVNSAEREFNHSSQGTRILKRHSDGTYSERGAAWQSREAGFRMADEGRAALAAARTSRKAES